MKNSNSISTCPAGESFPLPDETSYAAENNRLQSLVDAQRALGREIVVVMGVGFVGAVMAGVVADSTDKETGRPNKFVIGMQRPSPRSFWKIPYLNRGIAPGLIRGPGGGKNLDISTAHPPIYKRSLSLTPIQNTY